MDQPRSTADEDADYDDALENTFPASDPPAAASPYGGITGPAPPRNLEGKS